MSTGYQIGSHQLHGISDEFIPAIAELQKPGKIIKMSDGDTILRTQKLARQSELAVHISSGAHFIGAVQLQNRRKQNPVVVTVVPDK